METETPGSPHAAGLAAFVFGAHCMAGILDNGEPMPPRNFKNAVHVAALAVQVNRKNCFGLRRDVRLEFCGVEVVSDGIDINEVNGRPQGDARRGSGDPGHGRRQNLVARFQINGSQREKKCCGSVADGSGMGCPAIRSKISFELYASLATGRRSLAQHAQNRLLLLGSVLRAVLNLKIKFYCWRTHERRLTSCATRARIGAYRLM